MLDYIYFTHDPYTYVVYTKSDEKEIDFYSHAHARAFYQILYACNLYVGRYMT